MKTAAFCAFALLTSAVSQPPFQHERTIAPGAAGPNRLDVDVALLAGSPAGFPDLRLYKNDWQEVPYLEIEPQSRERRWTGSAILDIASTKTTSGFEADLGGLRQVDRLRLNGIRAPYLKHVTLEGSGDRAHWTLLGDTTVFDLPDQNLKRAEIAFSPGSFRYLRVTWDDRTSARVARPVSADARLYDVIAPPEPLRATLPVTKLASEPGKSRYRLDLPGPHLPITAIEVNSSGGDMFRTATITEPQLTNGAIVPVTLGNAQLRRAVRDGFVAAQTAIPIASPGGRELELIVDDGSNPPLPQVVAVARFAPQPWIYFEATDSEPITARYGVDTLRPANYDLEAVRPYVGRAPVAFAHWTSTSAVTPATTRIESGPPLPAFGAALDRKSFRVARPLPVSKRGLAVLQLDAGVLSVSRNLADVRLLDRENRQIPYIVEHRDEPLTVQLKVPPREQAGSGESRYALRLPYATLPSGTRLVLTTTARIFERSVRLVRAADEQRGRDEVELAGAEWRNTSQEIAAVPLTFDVPLSGTRSVDLVINEGDNAPMPVSSAKLLLPSYALRFNHPGGPLTLVYGNDEVSSPRYDIALIAPQLLNEPARTISIVTSQPAGHDRVRVQARYFWIVIAIAAIVLLALLARLLTAALKEPGSLGETPGGGDATR